MTELHNTVNEYREYRTSGDSSRFQSVVSESRFGTVAGARNPFGTVSLEQVLPELKKQGIGVENVAWIRGFEFFELDDQGAREAELVKLLSPWCDDTDNRLIYVELYEDEQRYAQTLEQMGFVRRVDLEVDPDTEAYLWVRQ